MGTPRLLAAFRWSPGQDPEAAGVLRQGFGYAELGREVGHLHQGRAAPVLEPAVDVHVAAQVGMYLAQEGHEGVVLGQRFEPLPGYEGEDLDGVMLGALPQIWVYPAKNVAGPFVP